MAARVRFIDMVYLPQRFSLTYRARTGAACGGVGCWPGGASVSPQPTVGGGAIHAPAGGAGGAGGGAPHGPGGGGGAGQRRGGGGGGPPHGPGRGAIPQAPAAGGGAFQPGCGGAGTQTRSRVTARMAPMTSPEMTAPTTAPMGWRWMIDSAGSAPVCPYCTYVSGERCGSLAVGSMAVGCWPTGVSAASTDGWSPCIASLQRLETVAMVVTLESRSEINLKTSRKRGLSSCWLQRSASTAPTMKR